MKKCKTCGESFIGKGPASLYCDACPRQSKTKGYHKAAQMAYRQRHGKGEAGVGKGRSSRNKGNTAPGYKNGWTTYKTRGRELKIERGNCCERCQKSLVDATRREWVCHHRDHDRGNPVDDNLEILCKRCHQIEHECWLAFEGATTSP